MQNYPPVDTANQRAQNPGPLPVNTVGNSPIRRGDGRANLVRHLQKMLFQLGYLLGSNSRYIDGVDGDFGADTTAAVQEYQRDHLDWDGTALVVDGIVGERTADSLNREMVGIWYGSYSSTDKAGNAVPRPPNRSLVTVDIDSLFSTAVALLLSTAGNIRVVIHQQGAFPNLRPDRSVNFIPNDPEVSGPVPPLPAPPIPRFLSKETHLFHLHGNNLPTWAIRDQPPPAAGPAPAPPAPGTPIPVPLQAFMTTGPQQTCVHFPGNPPQNFPEPGRFPAGVDFPGTSGDFQFQRGHNHMVIAVSVRTWLMRGFVFNGWRTGTLVTPVPPLANPLNVTLQDTAANLGGPINGFYTRPNQVNLGFNGTLFIADSADFVGHEIGHGILDAVAPQLVSSGDFEARSFHESFGDITALLNALSDPDVREEMIRATAGNLSQNSLATRWSEAIGRFLAIGGPARNIFTANAAPNFPFNYRDPATLPLAHTAGNSDLTEVIRNHHSFSVVFSSAFYDCLVNAFVSLRPAGANDDQTDSALRRAAGSLGSILARAAIRQPAPAPAPPPVGANPHPVRGYYWLLAREMFRVDRDVFGSTFRNNMRGTGAGNGLIGRDLVRAGEI